ncbi:MAG: TonB-dependent receptor [Alishewanella sp.]|nr:TonB-dependent receptor [Alishewanella sp.]
MHSSHSQHFAQLSKLAAAISLTVFANPVMATDSNEPTIEHIQVEGQRQPVGMAQQLLASELQAQVAATSDTAALLNAFAGVSVNQTGAVSSLPMIRGLADDRLRIKVDGMDLIAACPNHMNPPLSYMAPSDVGQLSVFAGVTPVSVGGDSIGGTIISESKAAEFSDQAETTAELGGFYRSNNQARGSHLKVSYSSADLYASYSGNWSKGNNYTAAANFKTVNATGRPGETLPLDEVGSSAYETQNHQLRFAYKTAADLIELQLGYQNMPMQLYPNQRMDLLDNEQQRINLSWQRTTAWGQWQSRIYQEKVEHVMDFGPDRQFWYGSNAMGGQACAPIRFHGDPAGTCAAGMPMHSDSTNRGLSLNVEMTFLAHSTIRLGSELQQFSLDDYWPASGGGMGPGTFLNINNGRRDRSAVFAEHELTLTPDWLLLYGVRVERVTRNADEVQGYDTSASAMGMQVPNAAAFNQAERKQRDTNLDITALTRYQLTDNMRVELALAQKMRSANLYEAYPWSFWPMAASMNNLVGDGNGYVGNIALAPEKAHTVSASLAWQSKDKQQQVIITPYYTDVQDYIDAVAANSSWLAGQFNVLQYQNQRAKLRGIDLSAETTLANNNSGQWQLKALFSYIDARNTDTDAGLHNVQPLHGKLTLNHTLAGWENSLEWQISKNKNRVSTIRGEPTTAGYALLNARFSHSWQSLRLDVGVENLLDKFYYLPQGGVYTGQGMTMSLNGIPFGIGVPGMGRTVYAGFNYTF